MLAHRNHIGIFRASLSAVTLALGYALVFQLGWNLALTSTLGITAIRFKQALGFALLAFVLTSLFRRRTHAARPHQRGLS